jgi:hypothetical protein
MKGMKCDEMSKKMTVLGHFGHTAKRPLFGRFPRCAKDEKKSSEIGHGHSSRNSAFGKFGKSNALK